MGDRLRYGDAYALAEYLVRDPSSMVGAKAYGLKFPAPWQVLHQLYQGLPEPLDIEALTMEREAREQAAKQAAEREAAKAMSPIFQGLYN